MNASLILVMPTGTYNKLP